MIVTEQNPKGALTGSGMEEMKLILRAALGATVPLPLANLPASLHPAYSPLAKTKFSMVRSLGW